MSYLCYLCSVVYSGVYFWLACLRPVSCVPNVTSPFYIAPSVFSNVYFLYIAPSVFSNVYFLACRRVLVFA